MKYQTATVHFVRYGIIYVASFTVGVLLSAAQWGDVMWPILVILYQLEVNRKDDLIQWQLTMLDQMGQNVDALRKKLYADALH